MIYIFFENFDYDKEYYFVADIAYEYVIILNLISQIITINRNNIVVLKVVSAFSLGDHGFLVEKPFGTCLICAAPRQALYPRPESMACGEYPSHARIDEYGPDAHVAA